MVGHRMENNGPFVLAGVRMSSLYPRLPPHAVSFWPAAHVGPSLRPRTSPGSGNQGLLGNALGKKKWFYVLLTEGSYLILGQSLQTTYYYSILAGEETKLPQS